MKIKKDMVLRQVGGDYILVPTGDSVFKFNGLFTLTESAAFIWQHLEQAQTEQDIVNMMLEEYDAEEEKVRNDVADFLKHLRDMEII